MRIRRRRRIRVRIAREMESRFGERDFDWRVLRHLERERCAVALADRGDGSQHLTTPFGKVKHDVPASKNVGRHVHGQIGNAFQRVESVDRGDELIHAMDSRRLLRDTLLEGLVENMQFLVRSVELLGQQSFGRDEAVLIEAC